MRTCAALLRGLALLAVCATATLGVWRLARDPLAAWVGPLLRHDAGARHDLAPHDAFDHALAGLSAGLLLVCSLWLLVTSTVAVAAYVAERAAPGRGPTTVLGRVAERGCPLVVCRLVAGVVGVAFTAGLAAPAMAGQPGPAGLTGLALPDRVDGSSLVVATPGSLVRRAPTEHLSPVRAVVVRPGDSLWSIAAALLRDHASDAAVDTAWHRLHRANLARLGPDPDLILPGTRLVVPDLTTPHREEAR